jgi:hypothetical protein
MCVLTCGVIVDVDFVALPTRKHVNPVEAEKRGEKKKQKIFPLASFHEI